MPPITSANTATTSVSSASDSPNNPNKGAYFLYHDRVHDRGDVFYIFAADEVADAMPDGTCGPPTTEEKLWGCLPAEY